jgi:hypothetical protein
MVQPSLSAVLGRVSLFVLVASGLACSAVRPVEQPVSLTFRPTAKTVASRLATSIAVEVTNEHDARAIEAADPIHIGEIGVRGGRIRPSDIALIATEKGATHFRVVCAGDDLRVDVVLFRVERERWSSLPDSLRPAPPAGPLLPDEPQASL